MWTGGRGPAARWKQSGRGSKEVEGPGRRQGLCTVAQRRPPGWTTQCGALKSPQAAMCQRSGVTVPQNRNWNTPRALKRCRRCSPLRPGRCGQRRSPGRPRPACGHLWHAVQPGGGSPGSPAAPAAALPRHPAPPRRRWSAAWRPLEPATPRARSPCSCAPSS